MSDYKLLPCPFCGGGAVIKKHSNTYSDWWLVSCPKCHITQAGSENELGIDAADQWNTRAQLSRQKGE